MRNGLDDLHITVQTVDEHFDKSWGKLRRSSEDQQQSVKPVNIQKGYLANNISVFPGQKENNGILLTKTKGFKFK